VDGENILLKPTAVTDPSIIIARPDTTRSGVINYWTNFPAAVSAAQPLWQAGHRFNSGGYHILSNDGATTTDRMFISTDGDVGIATTDSTSAQLTVNGIIRGYGSANGYGEINLENTTSGTFTGFQFRKDTPTLWAAKSVQGGNDLAVYVDNNSANGLYIQTGGEVGVGTTNPTARLHVAGTMIATGGNIVDGINFDSNTVSIDALNNRVGILTAAPIAPLDVAGDSVLGNVSGASFATVIGGWTMNLTDNIGSIFSVLQGANEYIEIDTTNANETIQFGAVPAVTMANTVNVGDCTLDGSSPSVCIDTVRAGSKCTLGVEGATPVAANCVYGVSGTTLTITCANTLTNVVAYHCFAPN